MIKVKVCDKCSGMTDTTEGVVLDPGEFVCVEVDCPNCLGNGEYPFQMKGPNYEPIMIPCGRCDQTGKILKKVLDARPKS